MPWLNMWEMALEEKEDKETWERTRWTWGISDTCNKSGQRTEQWVTEMRDLPHIVTDHAGRTGQGRKDNREQRVEDMMEVKNGDNYVDVYTSSIDILKHMNDKHMRDIPIIVESEADDDEMDDYYENYKAWPGRSS